MLQSLVKSSIKLSKNYVNSIETFQSNFEIIIKPLESVYNGSIYLGGSLGKKTLIEEDNKIFLIMENHNNINSHDFENVINKKMKKIIPSSFLYEIQKNPYLIYRHKYVIQFLSEYPKIAQIIQILKIWNRNRQIKLEETVLELLAIEARFRTNLQDPFDKDILVSCFQTLHNTLEGISIIPRNWQKYEDITALVSNLGIKIVDPGDPSVNLANNISLEQDIQIRNESLRAISLINDDRIDELLIEIR